MISKEDIICTDKYLDLQSQNIVYLKTDLLYLERDFQWRNKTHSLKSGKIWITGHSDHSITSSIFKKYHQNCSVWFAINKDLEHEKIFSLPLGITNLTKESPLHPIYGNTDIMYDIMMQEKNITNLVYMNFNINTFKEERQKCYDIFKEQSWVTLGKIENTLRGRKKFLEEIKNHHFVLCPRGNGIDTHRLWETLYMGSFPIVKQCIALNEFADLPILFIDNWDQVNEDFLNKKLKEMRAKQWNMDKLKFSYWKKGI